MFLIPLILLLALIFHGINIKFPTFCPHTYDGLKRRKFYLFREYLCKISIFQEGGKVKRLAKDTSIAQPKLEIACDL